jgi:Viral BACON domain
MSNVFAAGPSFALNLNSSKTLPLAIVNKSGQPLSWQALWAADSGGQNWLSLDRNAGNLAISEVQTIYVTANSARVVGAVPGDFSGRLTITPTVGGIAQVAEVLTIELHVSPGVYSDNGPKAPTVSQSRFDFNTQMGIMGPSQLQVTSNSNETNNVNWTLTSNENWLSVNPTNGTFLVIGGVAPPPINFNVAVQNAPATRGTYTTDLILTLTFSDPALASHEPTSILIPISVVV